MRADSANGDDQASLNGAEERKSDEFASKPRNDYSEEKKSENEKPDEADAGKTELFV